MGEKKRRKNWELIVVGGVCIVISLLHLFGLFEQRWLLERISTITLLVVGLFITFLTRVLQRIDYEQDLSDIKEKIEQLLAQDSTAGLEIKQFDNVGDVYDYVSSRLRSAREGVKDITWGSYTGYRTSHEQECYENYVKTIEDVCKSGDVVYEEISSLSDEHYFLRSAHLLRYYSYHLAYHDISCIDVPLISYAIIDAKEVVLGFCRVPGITRPLDNIIYLSVTNPLLVKFFFDYYVSMWHQAVKLKDSTAINEDKIAEIRTKLGIN